jgi:plastocyanin
MSLRSIHVLIAIVALLAVACGGTGGSAAPSAEASAPAGAVTELAVTGTEYAFEAPASVASGPTRITLTNDGAEEHQAQVARLNDGTTMDDLTAALQESDAAGIALLTLAGGPNGVQPGESGAASSTLAPGAYVFLCFVPAPDGVPHIAKGMIAPLEVTEPANEAAVPAGDTTLTLQDFAFVGLDTLSTGPHTVTVTNTGPQPHEATIVRLNEGIGVPELLAMFTSTEPPPDGPPPFTSVGGLVGIMADDTASMEVDLPAGSYAFICFVPDPASGAPHAALGMIGALTVE